MVRFSYDIVVIVKREGVKVICIDVYLCLCVYIFFLYIILVNLKALFTKLMVCKTKKVGNRYFTIIGMKTNVFKKHIGYLSI